MAGMRNQLNLMANEVGSYKGISANYSGHGFSGMKFTAEATTQEGFEQWVSKTKSASSGLTFADYLQLAKPSEHHPVTHYSSVEAGLYDKIVAQFMPDMSAQPAGKPMNNEMGHDAPMAHPKHEQHGTHDMAPHTESGE